MDLWIALSVFNEERLLPGCLQSIRECAPSAKVVAVDGSYESWVAAARRVAAQHLSEGHEQLAQMILDMAVPASTDKTLDLLRAFPVDRLVTTDAPWEHEYVKRCQYLVGKPGDVYLVLDADERLCGKVDLSGLTGTAYNVMFDHDETRQPYPVLRMFRHGQSIEYRGAHHAIHIDGTLYKKEPLSTVGGKPFGLATSLPMNKKLEGEPFWIKHLRNERSRDQIRTLIRGEYYRYLTTREEGAFRAVHGL